MGHAMNNFKAYMHVMVDALDGMINKFDEDYAAGVEEDARNNIQKFVQETAIVAITSAVANAKEGCVEEAISKWFAKSGLVIDADSDDVSATERCG